MALGVARGESPVDTAGRQVDHEHVRTPESDESGSEGAGSLADGFGTVVDSDDDTNFGEGSGDDGGGSALRSGSTDDLVDGGDTQVFLDPRDSYTDEDLDLNGDGLVDAGDLHTALSDFFDMSVGSESGDDGAEADDAGHLDHHPHDDGHDGGGGLLGF